MGGGEKSDILFWQGENAGLIRRGTDLRRSNQSVRTRRTRIVIDNLTSERPTKKNSP